MALTIMMDRLIRDGHVRDYAELARLAHVSRARVSQIMNLNLLAPDIQEELLFLPRVQGGRDPIREHAVRPIAATLDWRKQRRMWRRLSELRSWVRRPRYEPPEMVAGRPRCSGSYERRAA